MSLDSTQRFSTLVDDYIRYRPSYPAAVVPLLEQECGLDAGCVIADAGSGTGLLAKQFLLAGHSVIGIEPNAEMRAAGDALLADFAEFRSTSGRAEETGLADASVGLVVAGQAFHWFDAAAARREFQRILRPPHWVALIWNERIVPEDGFLKGYEEMLRRHAPGYASADHRKIDAGRITAFFGHGDWKLATFGNAQEFDLAGARGRLLSSSYAPRHGSRGHQPMLEELERLFAAHHDGGRVQFLYETKVYYGKLG